MGVVFRDQKRLERLRSLAFIANTHWVGCYQYIICGSMYTNFTVCAIQIFHSLTIQNYHLLCRNENAQYVF